MLQSVTEYYRVLQSITENSRVLQNIKEYYRVFLAHLLGPISGLVFCDPKPEEMMFYNTVTFLPIKCNSDRNLLLDYIKGFMAKNLH